MSLVHDLNETLRDGMNLASDWMKFKLSAESRSLCSHFSQMILWLAVVMLGFLLILAGMGFILWGLFYQMLKVAEPGAAALILGTIIILIAIIIMLAFKAMTGKK